MRERGDERERKSSAGSPAAIILILCLSLSIIIIFYAQQTSPAGGDHEIFVRCSRSGNAV